MKHTIGFTNGCFDLLHPGHVATLVYAASRCNFLVVGINSDASVRRLKGEGRPIQSESERCAIVSEIKGVCKVIIFEEDRPWDLVKRIMPDAWIKGEDGSAGIVEDRAMAGSLGIEFEIAPHMENFSTTGLIDRIKHNE